MRLLLVRHAMPEMDPAVPPDRWRLAPAGRAAAAALRLPPHALLTASDQPKAVETVRLASGHPPPGPPGTPVRQDGPAASSPDGVRGVATRDAARERRHRDGDRDVPTRDRGRDGPGRAGARERLDRDGGSVLRDSRFAEVRHPPRWRPDHRALARAYVEGTAHDGWEPRHQVVARFGAAVAAHAARAGDRPLVVGTHGMAMTCWLADRRLLTVPPGEFWSALAFPQIVEVAV